MPAALTVLKGTVPAFLSMSLFTALQALAIRDECARQLATGPVRSADEVQQAATLPAAASYSNISVRLVSSTAQPATLRPGVLVHTALQLSSFVKAPGFGLVGVALRVVELQQQQQAEAAAGSSQLAAATSEHIRAQRGYAQRVQAAEAARELKLGSTTRQQHADAAAGLAVNPCEGTHSALRDSMVLCLAQLPLPVIHALLLALFDRGRGPCHPRVLASTAGTRWHGGGSTDACAVGLVLGLLPRLVGLRSILAGGVDSVAEADGPVPGTLLAAAAAQCPAVNLLSAAHSVSEALAQSFAQDLMVAIGNFMRFAFGKCCSLLCACTNTLMLTVAVGKFTKYGTACTNKAPSMQHPMRCFRLLRRNTDGLQHNAQHFVCAHIHATAPPTVPADTAQPLAAAA
jgi:hypothetical protein